MEIILPAAGLSTRFPNMRPKFTLTDYKGMICLRGRYNTTLANTMLQ